MNDKNGRKIFLTPFLAAVGYTLLSLIFTYPLIAKFSTAVAGGEGDTLQFLWGLWHLKNAVLQGTNPFFAPEIFPQLNVSLILHTWTPLKLFLSLPLLSICNLIAAFNLIYLATFVLNALGVYFLIISFFPDKRVAFLGGSIFAFAPFHMAHGLGHFNMMSTEAIPWLLVVWRATSIRAGVKTVLLALLSIYLFFSDYQLFVYMGIFAVAYIGYIALYNKNEVKPVVVKLAKVVGLFFLMTSTFWIMFLGEIYKFPSLLTQYGDRWGWAHIYSLDLLSILVPPELHPLWGAFASRIIEKWDIAKNSNIAERTAFIGYFVLLLALIDVIRNWHERFVKDWGLLAALFFLLAFGPYLHFAGHPLNSIPHMKILSFDGIKLTFPMPYVLIHYLPFVNSARVPSRFIVVALLAIVMLFASSLYRAIQSSRYSLKQKNVFILFAFICVFVELLPTPYLVGDLAIPNSYEIIKNDPEPSNVVLDLPSPPWTYDLRTLYYQTYHQHNVAGGWTARLSNEQIKYKNKYDVFRKMTLPDQIIDFAEIENAVIDLNVKYIVARDEISKNKLRQISDRISRLLLIHRGEDNAPDVWEYNSVLKYNVGTLTKGK